MSTIKKIKVINPIDDGWYADPEARYYEGKYWIYATVSQKFEEQVNQVCFSSEDLSTWEKHEDIIDMSGFPWATHAIWAPTIIEKNGNYYYIFASNNIMTDSDPGGLEIAVSDRPEGPFKAYLGRPLIGEIINGAQPIDAHLFKDDDGTIYLIYGGWKHCNICIMNDDMTGFLPFEDGSIIKEITPADYVEGPCMFKKDGKYYFMWSSGKWGSPTYRVNAAVSDSPLGPFDDYNTILSTGESTVAKGPGHNGYLYVEDLDLYLNVYHRNKIGENERNARYLCIDVMNFDENGKIEPVVMTNEWKIEISI